MAEYRVVMKNDELYHWKYLDKYKKNGEWVYIYDEAKNKVKNTAKSVSDTAKSVKKKAGFKVGTIRRKTRHAVYDTKKAVRSAYSNASKAATNVYNKAKSTYNDSRIKVEKAYNNAKSAVKEVAKKTLDAVKSLIEKGVSAVRRVLSFFSTGESTVTKHRIVGTREGNKRIINTKNTTITNSGFTEYVRKGKKILMKAVGKNTNTYRTDRLR